MTTHADAELATEDPWAGDVPPMPVPEERESTGWSFFDLESVLDGSYKPPQPTVGCRDDGVGLFYPGKLNSVAGESEGGKTWMALLACVTEMKRGNHVVYLDFEDDAGAVVTRLLVIGATPQDVRTFFHYVRPEAAPDVADRATFMQAVAAVQPTLAVADGVTEGMSMFGLELKDNTDIAKFGQHLLRPFIKLGAAAVTLDHVVKSGENRGRYALGGVHKLNGLSGVMYIVEPIDPFGIGVTGRSRIRIAKDRPAQIRRHALPGKRGDMHWYADLIVESRDETFAEAFLRAPLPAPEAEEVEVAEKEKEREAKEEAQIRAAQSKILAALREAEGPLSGRDIDGIVPGRGSTIRRALTRLVHNGTVQTAPGPKGATLHSIAEHPRGES